MPHRNPCRLYIHRAFTYSLRWSLEQLECEVGELGRAPPFPPMRVVLDVPWSRALSLVCEVALTLESGSAIIGRKVDGQLTSLDSYRLSLPQVESPLPAGPPHVQTWETQTNKQTKN